MGIYEELPKQQAGSATIPPDDICTDSVFCDKKCGMHGVRDDGIGAERLIPHERNHSGPAGKPSDKAAIPNRFRLAVTKQTSDA